MAKTSDVDKAKRSLPVNALPGVAELNSNFTTIIAEVNPDSAGSDSTPVDCDSIGAVAKEFEPKLEFQVKKVSNLGAEKVDETTTSVTMEYGKEPSQVMSDFEAENIVVKAKTTDDESERVLMDQLLAFHALEDLQAQLRDQKVAKLFETDRDGLIQLLEAEIVRLQKLLEEQKLEGFE